MGASSSSGVGERFRRVLPNRRIRYSTLWLLVAAGCQCGTDVAADGGGPTVSDASDLSDAGWRTVDLGLVDAEVTPGEQPCIRGSTDLDPAVLDDRFLGRAASVLRGHEHQVLLAVTSDSLDVSVGVFEITDTSVGTVGIDSTPTLPPGTPLAARRAGDGWQLAIRTLTPTIQIWDWDEADGWQQEYEYVPAAEAEVVRTVGGAEQFWVFETRSVGGDLRHSIRALTPGGTAVDLPLAGAVVPLAAHGTAGTRSAILAVQNNGAPALERGDPVAVGMIVADGADATLEWLDDGEMSFAAIEYPQLLGLGSEGVWIAGVVDCGDLSCFRHELVSPTARGPADIPLESEASAAPVALVTLDGGAPMALSVFSVSTPSQPLGGGALRWATIRSTGEVLGGARSLAPSGLSPTGWRAAAPATAHVARLRAGELTVLRVECR